MVAINWYKDTEIGTDSNYFRINVKPMRTDNKLCLCLISLPKPQLLTNTFGGCNKHTVFNSFAAFLRKFHSLSSAHALHI